MKRFFGIVFALLFTLTPMILKAEEATKVDVSKYNTLNFKETLADEEIKEEFTGYSENDNQITIYLFRGKGCGYCRAFLNFLNGITTEYGQYFKVVSFETWYDEDNGKLLNTISNFMGEQAGGVPYIVIGDKVFAGYASSYDDSIKEAITALYESKDRYDVFEEYNKSISEAKKAANAGTTKIVIWNFVFVTIATVIICCYINSSNKKLVERLTRTNRNMSAEVKQPVKEISEPVKETKKTVKRAKNGKTKKTK